MANKALQGTIDAIGKDTLYLDKKIDAVIQGVQEDLNSVKDKIPSVTRFVKSPDVFVPNLSVVDVMPATPDSHTIYFVISEHKIFVGGTEIWNNTNEGSIVPVAGDVILFPRTVEQGRLKTYSQGVLYDGPEITVDSNLSTTGIDIASAISETRILIVPEHSINEKPIRIYDTASNMLLNGPNITPVPYSNDSKYIDTCTSFYMFVKISDEKILCVPRASMQFYFYNPKTNVLTNGPTHTMGGSYTMTIVKTSTYYYTGGFSLAIKLGKKIFMVPTLMTDVSANVPLIYDTETDTMKKAPNINNIDFYSIINRSCVKLSESKVFIYSSNKCGIYDVLTESFDILLEPVDIDRHSNGSSIINNKIIFCPPGSNNTVGIYNTATNVYTNGPSLVYAAGKNDDGTIKYASIGIGAFETIGNKVLMFSVTKNETYNVVPSVYEYDATNNTLNKVAELGGEAYYQSVLI